MFVIYVFDVLFSMYTPGVSGLLINTIPLFIRKKKKCYSIFFLKKSMFLLVSFNSSASRGGVGERPQACVSLWTDTEKVASMCLCNQTVYSDY